MIRPVAGQYCSRQVCVDSFYLVRISHNFLTGRRAPLLAPCLFCINWICSWHVLGALPGHFVLFVRRQELQQCNWSKWQLDPVKFQTWTHECVSNWTLPYNTRLELQSDASILRQTTLNLAWTSKGHLCLLRSCQHVLLPGTPWVLQLDLLWTVGCSKQHHQFSIFLLKSNQKRSENLSMDKDLASLRSTSRTRLCGGWGESNPTSILGMFAGSARACSCLCSTSWSNPFSHDLLVSKRWLAKFLMTLCFRSWQKQFIKRLNRSNIIAKCNDMWNLGTHESTPCDFWNACKCARTSDCKCCGVQATPLVIPVRASMTEQREKNDTIASFKTSPVALTLVKMKMRRMDMNCKVSPPDSFTGSYLARLLRASAGGAELRNWTGQENCWVNSMTTSLEYPSSCNWPSNRPISMPHMPWTKKMWNQSYMTFRMQRGRELTRKSRKLRRNAWLKRKSMQKPKGLWKLVGIAKQSESNKYHALEAPSQSFDGQVQDDKEAHWVQSYTQGTVQVWQIPLEIAWAFLTVSVGSVRSLWHCCAVKNEQGQCKWWELTRHQRRAHQALSSKRSCKTCKVTFLLLLCFLRWTSGLLRRSPSVKYPQTGSHREPPWVKATRNEGYVAGRKHQSDAATALSTPQSCWPQRFSRCRE